MRKLLFLSKVMTNLPIFVPGETLRGEDKPVVPATPLHDAKVVDCHVPLPDHLHISIISNISQSIMDTCLVCNLSQLLTCFVSILTCITGTEIQASL